MVPLNTRYTATRSHRHPGPHRRSAADRDGPVPRRRPDRPSWTASQLPALRHIVRVPIEAGQTADRNLGRVRRPRNRPRMPSTPRAAAVGADDVSDILFTSGTTGRSKGVLCAHRQSLSASAAWAACGKTHQRRPLPVHQPVLPQLRLQGRHPGLPADRRDADPAADLRSRAGDAGGPGAAHHRAARAADDLPDAARPPEARRLRPELAAVRRHRRRDRSGRADRAHAVRTRHRHRADRLRADRGQRIRHDVPTPTTTPSRSPPPAGARSPTSSCASTCAMPTEPATGREVLLRGPNVMLGYLDDPDGHRGGDRRRRLAAHRRRRHRRRGRQPAHHRPAQGHVHLRRVQRLPRRGRAGAGAPRRRRRHGGDRCAGRAPGRGGQGVHRAAGPMPVSTSRP